MLLRFSERSVMLERAVSGRFNEWEKRHYRFVAAKGA